MKYLIILLGLFYSSEIFAQSQVIRPTVDYADSCGYSDTALYAISSGGGSVDTSQLWQTNLNQQVADSSSKLGTMNSRGFGIYTNSLPRIWINSSGNIGIGTLSPVYKMDIQGTTFNTLFRIKNSGASGKTFNINVGTSGVELVSDGLLDIFSGSSHNIRIYTGSNLRMLINQSDGNIAIGAFVPTYKLSFDGNAARTIGMERHTTANTAGNNLTILAGGATSGATDKNGGNNIISSGTSTGNGGSSVLIQTVATNQGAGTSERTPTTTATFDGDGSMTATGYVNGKQVIGVLMDSTDQTTALVTTGYTTHKSFNQKISLNCTTTDSTITVPIAGYYDISFSCSFTFSVNSKVIHNSIFCNDVESYIETERKIGTGTDVGSHSMRGIIWLPANCVVKVKGITDGNGTITRAHTQLVVKLLTN